MALEVARAYDADKNLVPLYILTDGDPVYDPVTPGFTMSYNKTYNNDSPSSNEENYFNIIVTSTGLNPTGGSISIPSDFYIWNKDGGNYVVFTANVHFTILNTSKFNIECVLNLSYRYNGNFRDTIFPSNNYSVTINAGDTFDYTLVNRNSVQSMGNSVYEILGMSVMHEKKKKKCVFQ